MDLFDDNQRLQLNKMINENNVSDQTELIRNLKHSVILTKEINSMLFLKAKLRNETPEKIHYECMNECNFLYTYYTDIYNKIKKDEIDLNILNKFLNVLQRIEEGEINQHEGSFLVGTLLKELYIDSALKKADKLEKEYNSSLSNEQNNKEIIQISWKQFKEINKNL
jgi:hypothetical protein